MQPRVCIIEDDVATRAALHAQLVASARFQWHGEAGHLSEARSLIERKSFDVAIVDLDLLGTSALPLLPMLAERGTRTLVLTKLADEASIVSAAQAGASGYVLKDDAMIDLCGAIERVIAGESPISPAAASILLRKLRQQNRDYLAELSKREQEVLIALSEGLSYREIASRHHLSYHTVADHTKSIYRKLQVNSRGQAVAKYISGSQPSNQALSG